MCSVKSNNLVVVNNYKDYSIKTAAILPFDNKNEKLFLKHYPEAAATVYEAFETQMLELNVKVLDRKNLSKILEELVISQSGLTVSDGLKIGKLLEVDVIIFGSVTSYVQGGKETYCNR